MLFTDPERDRIADAIAAAELHTAGEIVVIVSTEAYRYTATALSVAALLALAVPFIAMQLGLSPAELLPSWDAMEPALRESRNLEILLVAQALIFMAVLALLHFTGLARQLTPKGLRHDRVHRAALTQFRARGFEATEDRTGVLIYVAEPEQIAEVIADTGIYAKVTPDHWGTTIGALLGGIKAGKPADGMVEAIGLAGAVLAANFPPRADDTNELPDHLIEI
jgi:putative membrane protein